MMCQMLLTFCLFVTVAFATPDVSHLLHDNHNHASSSSGYHYEKPTNFVQKAFVTDNQNIHTSYFAPASGTHQITTSNEYQPHQQYNVGSRNGINYVQQPTIQYNPTSYSNSNKYNNVPVQSYGQSLNDEKYAYDVTGEQLQQNDITIRLIPVTNSNYDTSHDQIIDYGTNHKDAGHPHRLYKVIFIKRPSYHVKSHIVPILPRNDEKTFIYVFDKQPTFETTVTAQQQPPAAPTKPEVVFIKYKTVEEAKRAEEQIKHAFESGHVPSVGAGNEATPGYNNK